MVWFSFLKSEGYFDPDKNPEPVQVKEGFLIPYWEALGYLEKLSIQISEGKETELINEVLGIIKNVSEHPKDNNRTWYLFIKILSNLPNERIPKEIFHFIPVWLSGRFDTRLQTSELCDKLLPKFLNDTPTPADIEKAETILHFLFQVQKTDKQEDFEKSNSYHSRLYLHFLARKFQKRDIIPTVVKHCSSNFILELGRTIKFLLLDYPIHTFIKHGDKEYEIKIRIENKNLLVSSKLTGGEDITTDLTLPDWESKSETELREELISILKQQDVAYIPTNDRNDTFERLNFALNNDLKSAFGFNSIRKLNDRYSSGDKALDVFALIFRDLLDEKVKQSPEEGLSILKTLCFDNKYRIPFFKRITLYVISENWDTSKSLFFELIKDKDDALHLFSLHKYQKELFDLLNKNQHALNADEIRIIESIIEHGKQAEVEEKEKQKEYWQLSWYSALKDIDPFKDKYLTLSKELNITSAHYEGLGEIKVRSGSISPITKDNLLEKNNQEIVEYIKAFSPKSSFEGPSISGLADILGSAVETQPEKFVNEVELYLDISYIYSYKMLNAFGEAWKKQKTFDWQKVLQYCLATLKSPKFYSGELQLENDGWKAKPDWTAGAIANLITDGLQNDRHSFDIALLPLAKEIVQILVSNLEQVDDFKGTNMDYPTYSLNSTAGKCLRALFDYSLHRARNLFKYEDKGKWEPDMKSLYEEALQKGILDAFILEGMYFEQFYFLDNDWITEQVKKRYESSEREWRAFMGGFAFGNPPFNKELYSIFYPHYEKAIDNNIRLKSFHNNGLVRHLTAFYFWKFETLSSEKLLFKFVNQASAEEIEELINFIWQQEDYPKTISELERNEFQQIIIDLWRSLVDKYENSSIEEEQKNLAALCNWIVFVPELNDVYTALILKSCKYIDKTYSTNELIEGLIALKTKGNPNTTAKAIGEIISSLNFKDYMVDFDKEFIKDLVSFLFNHGQNEVAAEFCNKMAAVHQQFFLREIYEANASK